MMEIDFIASRPGKLLPHHARNRFLFPLLFLRDRLRKRGVLINYLTPHTPSPSSSARVLCLDARAFLEADGRVSYTKLEYLQECRTNYDHLIWFDSRDSSGTTQFEVLSLVDKYIKNQYLKDQRYYRSALHTGRLYGDYICERYGICDQNAETPSVLSGDEDLGSMHLGWNLAYSDYRSRSHLERYINYALGFPAPRFLRSTVRPVGLQARFATTYDSRVISYHRQSYLDLARSVCQQTGISLREGRLDLGDYRRELQHSLAVLSPFGWGEICYRDFEAMLSGCALLKPSVEHLITWPDLFRDGETYIALPWDLESARRKMVEVLSNGSLLRRIGAQGQEAFRQLWTDDRQDEFIDRFISMIEPV